MEKYKIQSVSVGVKWVECEGRADHTGLPFSRLI